MSFMLSEIIIVTFLEHKLNTMMYGANDFVSIITCDHDPFYMHQKQTLSLTLTISAVLL